MASQETICKDSTGEKLSSKEVFNYNYSKEEFSGVEVELAEALLQLDYPPRLFDPKFSTRWGRKRKRSADVTPPSSPTPDPQPSCNNNEDVKKENISSPTSPLSFPNNDFEMKKQFERKSIKVKIAKPPSPPTQPLLPPPLQSQPPVLRVNSNDNVAVKMEQHLSLSLSQPDYLSKSSCIRKSTKNKIMGNQAAALKNSIAMLSLEQGQLQQEYKEAQARREKLKAENKMYKELQIRKLEERRQQKIALDDDSGVTTELTLGLGPAKVTAIGSREVGDKVVEKKRPSIDFSTREVHRDLMCHESLPYIENQMVNVQMEMYSRAEEIMRLNNSVSMPFDLNEKANVSAQARKRRKEMMKESFVRTPRYL